MNWYKIAEKLKNVSLTGKLKQTEDGFVFLFNETLLDFRPFGSWIKFERHIIKSCTCSYCNGVNPVWSHSRININTGSNQSKLLKYLRVRFNSPSNKSRTSWRRLTFKGIKYYYYLKWTLPRPELIAKKIMEIIGK